jgi:hypothetical protein
MTSDATTKTDFDLITDTVTVAVSVLFKMSKFCFVHEHCIYLPIGYAFSAKRHKTAQDSTRHNKS